MFHKRVLIGAVVTVCFWSSSQFAEANPPAPGGRTVVDVIYSDSAAPSGPVSLGLVALPEAIPARLILDGTPSLGLNTYGLDGVVSFELTLGDATWTADDLLSFSMTTETNLIGNSLIPIVIGLEYESARINTPTTPDDPDRGTYISNNSFSLTIQGTDRATDQPFEYLYQESMQTVTIVPEPATVGLVLPGALAMAMLRRQRRYTCPFLERDLPCFTNAS